MSPSTFPRLTIDDKTYVVVPQAEFERLQSLAGTVAPDDGPALPPPYADGTYPAPEYAGAALARKIVRRRRELGLTQADLARRARIRPETLNRLEKGKSSPDVATIDKIDRALKAAEVEQRRK